MASLNVGGGASGRKAVDADIPLVPFIDLLLCCVMFLLVTAVWNQLAAQQVQQQVPGDASPDAVPREEPLRIVLMVDHAGYVLSTTAGDRFVIPRVGDDYDREGLNERLAVFRKHDPNALALTVASEDGIAFAHLILAMDIASGLGFTALSLTGT